MAYGLCARTSEVQLAVFNGVQDRGRRVQQLDCELDHLGTRARVGVSSVLAGDGRKGKCSRESLVMEGWFVQGAERWSALERLGLANVALRCVHEAAACPVASYWNVGPRCL